MAERSQAKMIVLIVVLAIALLAVLLIQSGGLSGKGATPNALAPTGHAGETAAEPNGSPPIRVQTSWKRPDAVGPIARDPMRIEIQKIAPDAKGAGKEPDDVSRQPEEPQFLTTGIVFSTDQPSSVIIDGRILHEGDMIHGATVVKIAEQYAELSRGDKKWTIQPGQVNPEP